MKFSLANGLAPDAAEELRSLLGRLVDRAVGEAGAPTIDLADPEQHPVAVDGLPGPTVDREGGTRARIGGRYEDLGLIGVGGMGEVRRVRDEQLGRTLALKVLHAPLVHNPSVLQQFLREARATAQLQHPNIVPVHDLGRLPDGRSWFTMKEVHGRTLQEVVTEVHAVSKSRWQTGAQGWTFRRMVGAYLSVCRAVAYAHERGVVHRDLKPGNVMVGRLGEVYVLDWGLAKLVGRGDRVAAASELQEGHTARGSSDAPEGAGRVVGTPAYMPPEQARGELDRIGTRSDVYALGALLYQILSGRAPYEGSRPSAVLHQVLAGPPLPVGDAAPAMPLGFSSLGAGTDRPVGPALPAELVQACGRAMAREPFQRFSSALELAELVESWLAGAKLREQGLELTGRAHALEEEAASLESLATVLERAGSTMLAGLKPWEPEEAKAPAWSKLAEAEEARLAAELKRLEVDQGLHAALQVSPVLEEAHGSLALRYQQEHRQREAERDRAGMARTERQMRTHARALPVEHPVRQECSAYLNGQGALTLVTEPAGATVQLYRYEEQNRRLVAVFVHTLGTTPLVEVPMAMGSYLCVLQREGSEEVQYPVEIGRCGHWSGVAPGETEPEPVWLPPAGWLREDEVYVPAGWFRSGGDLSTPQSLPARRLWCHGLLMQRFAVTNRQYIAFLDALVAAGKEEEALRFAPRERAGRIGELGSMLYGRTQSGGFDVQVDTDGDAWQLDFPVIHVDWHGARAYFSWYSEHNNRPWRLPGELEWEKAARGVDGRWFPWGDHLDPSWCRMKASSRGRQQGDYGWVEVDSHGVDVSVYGVRGAGGNVRDWCLDAEGLVRGNRVVVPAVQADAEVSSRLVKGGAWDTDHTPCRVAHRNKGQANNRLSDVGLRGCVGTVPG